MDNNVSPLAFTAASPARPELEFQVSLLNLMKPGMASPLLVDAFELALSAHQSLGLVR